MSREELIDSLARHVPFDDTEREMTQRLLAFVEAHEDCFRRSLRTGHLTGSAWIVDRTRRRALLVHHKRLDRWMQPGGHWEQDDSLLETARREALEETGATSLRALGEDIFDVDVHPIPARGAEPAHFHYDVRFLFEADPDEPLTVSSESHAVEWVDLSRLDEYSREPSVTRMAAKVRAG